AGRTVYLLGGLRAIPAGIGDELESAGYSVVRYSGPDRFATAVAVANALGDPSTVLLATGTGFPDALAAGPAAAHVHGAVLLTDGTALPAATADYLSLHKPTVYAIGGAAVAADPTATAIVGADRFATAAAVASTFFAAPTQLGFAIGSAFPDALSGGAQLALAGAPLLLVDGPGVPGSTDAYIAAHSSVTGGYLYGGTAILSDTVMSELDTAISRP
ncbi:MAG TPA: cell wall-binding repeat-containing protein, partial [Acidothermaceae bacterium]|nr:cell wall-binding repeat-containing protein [Acidothermaceae bacterium]